jgi:Ca-activated chloride channel family protein
VNVAIVLDKSGSMNGEKIARAREGAIMAVNRLRPDDIVSVVAYNDTVEVLLPATKVRDREEIITGINRLEVGGRTCATAITRKAHPPWPSE